MRKITPLFILANALAVTSSAMSENLTPVAFNYKSLPVGKFEITAAGAGANPSGIDLGTPGHTVVGCGPAVAATFLPALKESACIVSSPFGNMLMIKGKDSSVTEGIASEGTLNTGWWNINFIGPKSEPNNIYRATVQMKLVTDMEANDTKTIKANYVTGGGNNNSLGTREVIYLGDEGWFQAQIQGTIGTTDPARLRFEIPAGIMDKSALYIYETRFEKNPEEALYNSPNDGTPGEDKPIGATGTSIEDSFLPDGSFVTWGGSSIYINQAKGETITIYSLSGELVKQFRAASSLEEVTIASGVYLVRIGQDVTKVVL